MTRTTLGIKRSFSTSALAIAIGVSIAGALDSTGDAQATAFGSLALVSSNQQLPRVATAPAEYSRQTDGSRRSLPAAATRDPLLVPRVEERLERIRSAVGITAAQQPVWLAHAEALREHFWRRKAMELWLTEMHGGRP